MKKHPRPSPTCTPTWWRPVRAGGILDTILNRLAVFMEKNDALVRKVKGAMIYPRSSCAWRRSAWSSCCGRSFPVFASMFGSVGMELPLPTRVVIGMSRPHSFWWASSWRCRRRYFIKKYYATPSGQLVIDRLLLHVPVLGDVLRKSAVPRFSAPWAR